MHQAAPEVVDLRDLIAEMDLGMLVSGEVSLCTDLPVTPCPVLMDRALLAELVFCLVSHARDAVLPRGTVRVGLDQITGSSSDGRRSGGWVQLEVSDSGPEMDHATLERALVPFYATRHEYGQRGLGLAIVHGLAREASGGMAIASHPEAGTAVRIWLPVADRAISNGRHLLRMK
ncbi:MAG: ATP-binding protein [Gemmatimonadota bacterium]